MIQELRRYSNQQETTVGRSNLALGREKFKTTQNFETYGQGQIKLNFENSPLQPIKMVKEELESFSDLGGSSDQEDEPNSKVSDAFIDPDSCFVSNNLNIKMANRKIQKKKINFS